MKVLLLKLFKSCQLAPTPLVQVKGAYPEQDELLFCLKFFLSKLFDFEIIGIKLKGSIPVMNEE
ncbi:MAG: hypothetical protein ACQEWI_23080 [Bacillota bacterium]